MDVSGLLHDAAALPTRKEPRYPMDKKLGGVHIYIQSILLQNINKRSVKEGCRLQRSIVRTHVNEQKDLSQRMAKIQFLLRYGRVSEKLAF
jgi:hypothetical protein